MFYVCALSCSSEEKPPNRTTGMWERVAESDVESQRLILELRRWLKDTLCLLYEGSAFELTGIPPFIVFLLFVFEAFPL